MNYLWGGMILIGIIYGTVTGHLEEVSEAAIQSSKEAVSLCVVMAGVTALWVGDDAGCREVRTSGGDGAENAAGAELSVSGDSRNHPSRKSIATNLLANVLGLGWAATPAGLKAMEELSDLEEERRRKKQRAVAVGAASNEMCDFLILNISSLQLIPVNIIAFRTEYGSVTPTAIVGPAILATAISTGAAVLYIKTKNWMARPEKANNIFTKMVLKNEKASHIMGESK